MQNTQDKNSFDRAKHFETLCKGGTFTLHEGVKYSKSVGDRHKFIHLEMLAANAKGNCFGTAVMHHAVERSLAEGYEGRVDVDASYQSHLFYLYMGMLPADYNMEYVLNTYGFIGYIPFMQFKENPRLDNLKAMCASSPEIKKQFSTMVLDAKGLPVLDMHIEPLPDEDFLRKKILL
jgi:hypothetical protein